MAFAFPVVLVGLLGACASEESTAATEISFLVPTSEQSVNFAGKAIEAFEKENPTIKVRVDTQPAGAEGDNLTKTKLSIGEMSDVFNYNTGSLLQALNPDQNLVNLADQKWVSHTEEDFLVTVRTEEGAAAYDENVEKQAQQLGIEG